MNKRNGWNNQKTTWTGVKGVREIVHDHIVVAYDITRGWWQEPTTLSQHGWRGTKECINQARSTTTKTDQPTNHTHSHTRKMLLKQETYTLPTPASASHQWTESTNPSYNQWLSQL